MMLPLTLMTMSALLLAQQPRDTGPRDSSAAPSGTASIAGRVTALDTGLPLRRAVVHLNGGSELRRDGKPVKARSLVSRTIASGADGVFQFRSLPAGRYWLNVMAGEHRSHYLPLNYGARSTTDIGKPLELGEGQHVQTQFALPRGGAIDGRVVDDTGEPVSGVTVGPVRVSHGGTFQPMGRSDQTDDQGRFRIYGLEPGEYVVSAEARSGGAPRVDGDAGGFATTYYPSAVSEHEASRVRVGPGSEPSGLEIALVRTRTFTIKGTLVDSQGMPVTRAGVTLMRALASGYGYHGSAVHFDGAGGFSIREIVAGNYLVVVRPTYHPDDPAPPVKPRREFAAVPVSVEADVEGLAIVTRPGTTLTGSVVFAEGVPAGPPPKVGVRAQPAQDSVHTGAAPHATVGSDLRFTLADLFGRYTLRAGDLPDGYVLKAVMLGATDITDIDTEFKPEHSGQVQIVLTNRVSVVEGRVTDDRGEPVSEVGVVLLPEDKPSWRWGNMRTRITVAIDGKYRLDGILPGRYYAIAVPRDRLRPSRRDEPSIFEAFLGNATTVVVGADEMRTVDLRVTRD